MQQSDRIFVDKVIDVFLKEHFIQYNDYCYYTKEKMREEPKVREK